MSNILAAGGVVTAVLVGGCTGSSTDPAPAPSVHAATALDLPRAVHRATVLSDGRVLITGGCTSPGCGGADRARRTEVYDPATDRIGYGPRLAVPRLSHTATLLPDGRVLVVGGYPGEGAAPTGDMEVLDLARDTVTSAGTLRVARADHTATLLADGRVLVAGGRDAAGRATRSAELVDPVSGRTESTTPLPEPRTAATAALVGDRVIVVGGTARTDDAVAGTFWFDPATRDWAPGPRLLRPRVKNALAVLPDRTVFIAGGAAGAETRDRFDDSEVLDPGAARVRPGPGLSDGRYKLADAAAVLPDGRIVLGGGTSLDVVDLARGVTTPVPVPGLDEPLSFQSVSDLPDGRVLVAGGYDDAIVPTDLLRVVRLR